MKINKLCVLMITVSLLASCSKLDETNKNAKDMKGISQDMRDRSVRMEENTNLMRRDGKAQATLEDMRASLDQIRQAETIQAMTAEASMFFGYMPFQKMQLSAEDKEKFTKRSVALFFMSPYNEYLPENNSVNPRCDVQTEPGCDASKRDRFTAFALVSDIIADEQKDYEGVNAKSFIDILIDIVSLGKKVKQGEVDYLSLSIHQKENLNFEDEAINFLQYVHNVMSVSAIKKVVDFDKLRTLSKETDGMMEKMKNVKDSITLPKTAHMYKALKDIQTSSKIIVALKTNGIAPIYSEQVNVAYKTLMVLKSGVNKKVEEMSVEEGNFSTLFGALVKHSEIRK